MNFAQLLYVLHEGFHHQIKPNFRAIAVGYVTGSLKLKVYCDACPGEDDDEIIREVLSETEAHIDGVKELSYKVIYTEDSIEMLDRLDFWYFVRYDVE